MERLIEMLEAVGMPYAYDHFAEGESPSPPFICYLLPNSSNFSADGVAYSKKSAVRVELYTVSKDIPAEKKIEDILEKYDIFYNKTEVWIESEMLYESVFSFEIFMEGA